ncbi:hypothetical protein B0H14DRAFT_3860482 [Mycena olivaceomarginata]|nr:hypothetical protein B0H14DRAFT_3860482 [Mycena olivaceomarginata]
MSIPMMLVDGARKGGRHSLVHTTSTVFESDGSNSSPNAPTNHNSSSIRSNLGLQVSSLLTDHRHCVQRRSHQLNVVQHPQKTAAFGYANLSRLPLTPAMVVRLTVCDANGNSIVPQDELPFLIGHLSLFTENGIAPLDMGSSVTGQPPPILYGSLLSSVNHLEDIMATWACSFSFRTSASVGAAAFSWVLPF